MTSKPQALGLESLRWHCDPHTLGFNSTDELDDLDEVLGQQRALESLRLGVRMNQKGYNVYALGPHGLHKHRIVERFLREQAAAEQASADWCYVNNFDEPNQPRALQLPAGRGGQLKRDMDHVVDELRDALRAAFEGEEYRTRRQMLEEELKERQEKAISEVEEDARSRGVALRRTPMGFTFAPMRDGKALSSQDFEQLPEQERERIQGEVEELQKKLQKVMRQVPSWVKEIREKLQKLNEETASYGIGHLFDQLEERYRDLPDVVDYVQRVRQDVVHNVEGIVGEEGGGEQDPQQAAVAALRAKSREEQTRRYRVNLLVDHAGAEGAPVVYEDTPTFDRLLGRIDHRAEMGALTTDFHLVRGGALHRANGGYLMLDVRKVLGRPLVYESLKRALHAREVRVEPPSRALGILSTQTLEPAPIPLDVKVVLVGERTLYYLLSELDPEFQDLFKIAADFDERVDRNADHHRTYARLVATMARREGLRAFDSGAVAKVLERAARLAGDASKLSTQLEGIADLLREADHWSRENGHELVRASDVSRAIEGREYRMGRVRERIHEEIGRGTILIDTEGHRTGQINALSVISLGSTAFGRPNRITARVRLGRGEVLDIEREVELGGAIHSKGVMILSGYLGARYAADRPLSLSATLVFEQSYGGIEGDSASSAELYALLSGIAGVPIRQDFAVTGSVNQHGDVQPIGGVNEKVEGFFDVCAERGLTGTQGVLVPHANVKHLMLDRRVLEAVQEGKFQVVAVRTIDEGLEVLTGWTAGEADQQGHFPDGSFNARVAHRLGEMAEMRRQFGASAGAKREEGSQ
jgi:lon-related putative ATP-dependent protease